MGRLQERFTSLFADRKDSGLGRFSLSRSFKTTESHRLPSKHWKLFMELAYGNWIPFCKSLVTAIFMKRWDICEQEVKKL